MKSKIKLIVMLVAMAAVLSTGCVNSSPKEIATSIPTPVITPSPTPVPTVTVTESPIATPIATSIATPVATPEGTLKDVFKEWNFTYPRTTSSKIYAGEMNGQFAIITGQVFNVLPRTQNEDLNGTSFDTIDFQIWGNALSHIEPIYVETLPERINGTIRDGILVEIKGFVRKDWMSGTNSYGGSISQPYIYASSVTVIPERAPD